MKAARKNDAKTSGRWQHMLRQACHERDPYILEDDIGVFRRAG